MTTFKYSLAHKLIAVGLSISLMLGACTKNFESLNADPNGISDEDLKQDFKWLGEPFIQVQQSIFGVNPNWVMQVQQNLIGDVFSGYMCSPNPFGSANNNNNTYNLLSNWTDVMWGCAYGSYTDALGVSVMPVCKSIGAKTEKDFKNYYAWMLILRVTTMHRIADAYGPIIYTKYGNVNADGSVDYDSQKDAYYAFFKDLNDAITILTPYAQNPAALKDFEKFDRVYAGSYKKWVRYANSLRLRLAIRISKIDPVKAKAEGEAALAHAVGLLESADEDCKINITPLNHPLNDFSNGWDDIRMGAPMESFLKGFNDPRLDVYFQKSLILPNEYKGIRQGVDMPDKDRYVVFSRLNNQASAVQVMPASEAWFLKAEAALLGWTGAGTAKTNYEKGVETSFSQRGVAAKYAAYIADNTSKPAPYVDPQNAANNIPTGDPILSTITIKWDDGDAPQRKLERIITQKWISGFPEGHEAWTEFRRTGYPKLFPVKINNSGGKIPTALFVRRVGFVTNEYTTNAKGVQKAITLLGGLDNGGTRLWWDKP